MMTTPKRCAIYTRKSSEEGLDQEFNSLHAQREACEAFIKSQKHEGWQLIKTAYDDGGISGGTMERPGLRQLLDDIKNHKVDIIMVYKVDRLTRSLADFAKMVELFDKHSVSFVSVTQQFNTTSSIGRLTLNVLLSFAQFEREVTSERIRDKIAASKMKGMWMGGTVPLGYEVKDRKLLVIPKDALLLRDIFQRYLKQGCVRLLQQDLINSDIRSVSGFRISRGTLYKMLSNPIYIGQIRHKGICYPGQHEAIVDQQLWNQVQQHIADNRNGLDKKSSQTESNLLTGKVFDQSGEKLKVVHAEKNGRRYRYYVSKSLLTSTRDKTRNGWRLSAHDLEQKVIDAAKSIFSNEASIVAIFQENEVELQHLNDTLQLLAYTYTSQLIEKFVEKVQVSPEGISLTFCLPINDRKIKFTRDVFMVMKRRGIETRMIMSNNMLERRDPKLIQTIIYAHKWFYELCNGTAKNIAHIAAREGFDKSYVTRVINLAFLAPQITECIINGSQPLDISVEKLTKKSGSSINWTDQRRMLEFSFNKIDEAADS